MDCSHFENRDFVKLYQEGPGRFCPGYPVMQRIAAQLIAERMGETGEVLVLGAGGGLELEAFAKAHTNWRFLAIDPAHEMLMAARDRMRAIGAESQVEWFEGYIFDAPDRQCHAATSLLTLHFVADDGGKLETLRAIRARMRAGAPFVLADLCMDKAGADHETYVQRYRTFALQSGAAPDDVAATVERVRHVINTVSAARNEELLREAGFSHPDLVYAGLSWRGWVSYA